MAQNGPAIRAAKRKVPALIALTLAYVIVGKLGLLLAVPPGYATAIFPPAGLAVAAMLVGGAITLPCTFLGSLLVNLWESYALAAALDSTGLAVAVVIAAASALQAGVAGTVLRRVLGRSTALDKGWDLARFVLLSPLCCLVSATVSHGGMLILGAVRAGELATSWLTWWVGDTLGVLFMVPLVLVVAGEPRALWRGRAVPVALPMLVLFAVFVAIFIRVSAWETDQSLLEYRLVSQQAADKIEAGLDEQAEFLDQLERSFDRGRLSRQSFGRLVERLPQHFPTIQAVEWAPRVGAGERPRFEAALSDELGRGGITERDLSGEMRQASDRAVYYPVSYIEPLNGNEEAIGFDLASDSVREAAIATTTASDTVAATAPIRLVQEHGTQSGLLLVRAVGEGANGPGVILVVLRIGDFLSALVDPTRSALGLRLVDRDTSEALFDSMASASDVARYERSFSFGTRHYVVHTEPTAAYFRAHRGWQSWSVLVAGVLCTGLLGALLLLGTGQTHRFEQLVAERTRDLETSQDKLHQSQKMEAVGRLAGGVAHDFNNLLTVILGSADVADQPDISDETRSKCLAAVQRAAERGARVTRQLLAFSRTQRLNPEIIEPSGHLRDLAALLGRSLRGDIALETDIPKDLWPVEIDATELELAVLNLGLNARDAMPNGGTIHFRAANRTIEDRRLGLDGDYLTIEIADTGTGIPPEHLPRVFEPFFTTKDVGAGSGLGLSQVHGFANQSGGAVDIESTPGLGTTVRLYLRVSHAPRLAAPPAPSQRHRHPASGTVLVVEDDPDVADVVAAGLRQCGLEVKLAHRARTALDLLQKGEQVDLIFSDILMPDGMSGIDLAEEVRSRFPALPILLATGYGGAAADAAEKGLQILTKPFQPEEPCKSISALLDARRR